VGTGPFKLKDNKPGELVEYVRNPDYFVKGRPYLDGIKFVIIRDRSTQIAALQSGQLDVAGSGWNKTNAENARSGAPKLILAEAGFTASNPLKIVVATRALAIYVDTASWMVDQLEQVGVQATLEQIETGVWHPKMTRLEYQVALNLTGVGVDDPDAQLFENYHCGSQRNFSGYCSEEID